jgi:hypothetical protein
MTIFFSIPPPRHPEQAALAAVSKDAKAFV